MVATVDYTRCANVPTISALACRQGRIAAAFAGITDVVIRESASAFAPKTIYATDGRFWIRNAGHGPAMWKRAAGADCKLVALAYLEGRYPLVTLRGSGIDGVANLAGRRLALFRCDEVAFDLVRAQQLKIYSTALTSAGLSLADVELVHLPPDAGRWTGSGDYFVEAFERRLSLLTDGTIDAFAFGAIPPECVTPDLDILYDTRLASDRATRANPSVLRGIVVSGPLLRERRDVVTRMLATLIETERWAARHPLEGLRDLAADLGKSPEALAASYDNIPAGLAITMDTESVELLAVQKEFYLANSLIRDDFDLTDWIERDILAEACRLAPTVPSGMSNRGRTAALISEGSN